MHDYSGQWLGNSIGNPEGRVIVDIEESDSEQVAYAYLFPNDGNLPSTLATFKLNKSERNFSVSGEITPFLPIDGQPLSDDVLKKRFPGVVHSKKASFEIETESIDKMIVKWRTEAETFGEVRLERSVLGKVSSIVACSDVSGWNDFKNLVTEGKFGDFIYRGQSKPFPLQTSFHRTKRKNLHFYLKNDIPILLRSTTGITKHLFDLGLPQQLGAFMNLAQHHGFPTPLLDWTYSPFVAAWFAFNEVIERGLDKEGEVPVRIFRLNKKVFSTLNQFQTLTFAPPHFSILEALAIENNRAVPQQGLLTLTNIQDVEKYLSQLGEKQGEVYLSAFDLPRKDALDALNELAMMGITRSTMYPGIESICKDLKDRLF